MSSAPELPDVFGEIEKIYKRIIQLELVIDATRNVVSKGVLTGDEEEHVILALNPSEIGKRETEALGISDETLVNSPLRKKHIPALKGLVEKELNETFDLIHQLENATSAINSCELDIPSKAAELQQKAADTSGDVHKLYKRLKTLLGLHTNERTSCLKTRFESLSLEASVVADDSIESEDAILRNIFHGASNEQLAEIAKDLEVELAAATEGCDMKEKELVKYESQKAQLLPLAETLKRLDQEIEIKKIALASILD